MPDNRSRNWSFVIPEDATEKTRAYFSENGLRGFISPSHDRDVNADGTPKFVHRHVMVRFAGKKSLKQVQEIAHACGAVNDYVQQVKDWVGYARYLCHLDNPEKAQYSPEDVLEFGGEDWLETTQKVTDDQLTEREILRFVRSQGITSYSKLVDYADETDNARWYRVLSKRTVFFTGYLRSMEWTLKQEAEQTARAEEEESRKRVRDAHAKAHAESVEKAFQARLASARGTTDGEGA